MEVLAQVAQVTQVLQRVFLEPAHLGKVTLAERLVTQAQIIPVVVVVVLAELEAMQFQTQRLATEELGLQVQFLVPPLIMVVAVAAEFMTALHTLLAGMAVVALAAGMALNLAETELQTLAVAAEEPPVV